MYASTAFRSILEGRRSPATGQIQRQELPPSSVARLFDLHVGADVPPEIGISTRHLVVFPYSGLFLYAVGSRSDLFDPTRALLITERQEFVDAQPVSGIGHCSLIVEPDRALLDELCGGRGLARHRGFARGCTPMMARTQLAIHLLLRKPASDLERDERLVTAMREVLADQAEDRGQSPSLVRRAKEYLHARAYDRVQLAEVADHLGVSAVYLTNRFSQAEGIPLYRYQLRLRLAQALERLPRRSDITELALDLGFSSHSHFTAAFRSQFGITPDRYRKEALS